MRLSKLLPPEARQALSDAGYEIVRRGDVPSWFERVPSMPAELYRRVQ